MSPLKATCETCRTAMIGEYLEDVGDLIIAHHKQGKEPGSWTSGGCHIFFVEEVDDNGEAVKGGESHYFQSTMGVIITPFFNEIIYDPRRKEGR